MYLDDFPELAFGRLVRQRAKGVPIRDGGRAVAIAWMADGTIYSQDTIVRFDVAEGEKGPRRLVEAFEQTAASTIRFFGADEIVRGALRGTEVEIEIDGAAFMYRRAPVLGVRVALRESTIRDSLILGELAREQSAAFENPKLQIAEVDHEPVGIVISDEIDKNWTEMRVVVQPSHRGNGYGAAIFATAADQLEAKEGRLICAGIHTNDERARRTLERGGFRLVDYYFVGTRRL